MTDEELKQAVYEYNRRKQEAGTIASQLNERIQAMRKEPLKADLLGFLRFAADAVKRLMEALR